MSHSPSTVSIDGRQRALSAPVDAVVLALGGWTLLCHAVVFAGGRPIVLYGLLAASGMCGVAGLAVGWRSLGSRGLLNRISDVADPLDSCSHDDRRRRTFLRRGYRLVAWVSCLAIATLYLRTHNDTAFYVACTIFFGLLYLARDALVDEVQPASRPSPALVLVLGLCVAAFVAHVHRPDIDEAFYQAMASSLAKFPDLPIYGFEPLHGDTNKPIAMAAYRVDSFELLSASLAQLLGVMPIRISHVLLPALAAVLLPFFLLRLARELAARNALWIVLMTLAALVMDGSVHRSFGNFAMVRFFQGKALFVTALVPAILAYGIRFGREPTRKRLLLLACAQIAAVGLTPTALPLAPMLAVIGVVAGIPALWRVRQALPRLGGSLLASVYPVLVALYLRSQMLGQHAADKLNHALDALPDRVTELQSAHTDLHDMLSQILGGHAQLAWYLGSLVILPAVASRMAVSLTVTAVTVFLLFLGNPLVQPIVEGHILGPSTYWRALWIIPVPMLLAVAWDALGQRAFFFLPKGLGTTITLGLFSLALLVIPTRTTFDARNGVRAPINNLSVDDAFVVAQTAARRLPSEGGVILAPPAASIWLSSMPQRAFPVLAKVSYIERSERAPRIYLERCLVDPSQRACNSSMLEKLLKQFDVRVVVTTWGEGMRFPLQEAMERCEFHAAEAQHGRTFWTR